MTVREGQDLDLRRQLAINERERKTTEQELACAMCVCGPAPGRLHDTIYRCGPLHEQIERGRLVSCEVLLKSALVFGMRFLVKLDRLSAHSLVLRQRGCVLLSRDGFRFSGIEVCDSSSDLFVPSSFDRCGVFRSLV